MLFADRLVRCGVGGERLVTLGDQLTRTNPFLYGGTGMGRCITVTAVLMVAAMLASPASAEPKSEELKVLNHFVGTWQGKTVSTNAQGEETTVEDVGTMTWVLGDSYLEDKIGDTLYGLWTYDKDEKTHRCWYFPAGSHKPLIATMKWNGNDSSFSGHADLGNGVTMTTHHQFIGKDKYEWSATVKDASGKVLEKLQGTKTRK